MFQSDLSLRRVSVHAGTAHVDVSLPAGVPVAALMPSIVDVLGERAGPPDPVSRRYRLSRPGAATMDDSMTLAQHAIQDGAVLVLTHRSNEPSAPCFDDPAEAVSTAVAAAAPRWTGRATRLAGAVIASCLAVVGSSVLLRAAFGTAGTPGATAGLATVASCAAVLAAMIAHRVYREPIAGLTLGLLGSGFGAVAGFVAVPGGPGAANVLLAATAAALGSAVAMRAAGCGTVTLTAVTCFALLAAAAALAAVITSAPLQVIGSLSAVASLVLVEASARMAIALAGLSPRLPSACDSAADEPTPDQERLRTNAVRAQNWLTALVVACCAGATLGAIGTAAGIHRNGGPRLIGIAFTLTTGAVLLLRARAHNDVPRTVALLAGGTATAGAAFVDAATAAAQQTPWICVATAILTAAALCLGFVTPALTFSPVARRGVESLEYLALAALVPLTCWICGLYGATRALSLT